MQVPEPREVRARVERVLDLTADVREVRLRLVEPARLPFLPGQYADFRIRGALGETEERGFSIASEPEEEGLLFAAKVLPHGIAGPFLRALEAGAEVRLRAPLGRFVLGEDGGRPRIFVGTGTGIAPLRGMLRHLLLRRRETRPVTLLFGVRDASDVFWEETFRALEAAHGNFRFLLTLSQPPPGWGGERGRVTDHLGRLAPDPGAFEVYVCGRPAMVEEVSRWFLERGCEPARLHRERFD
ncbi:MAG TPA: FAD-binding oxidoreductase [Planctomycetota bacterium]|jgi:NAD(P)H-flavin reductase|nr:FAD-binding oxidoreductase [Planctomycetota bacterium]